MSTKELARLSATTVDVDHIKVPSMLSAGNFSECRSVAVKFLQLGRGTFIISINSTFLVGFNFLASC